MLMKRAGSSPVTRTKDESKSKGPPEKTGGPLLFVNLEKIGESVPVAEDVHGSIE